MIRIYDKDVKIEGRFIRVAWVDGDKYRFALDLEKVVEGLLNCGTRVDLFTFMQRLPGTLPRYSYPMEWDNLAVLSISTFDAWWAQQIDSKTRNMVRKAEKKGVKTREIPFDESLVRGIWEIYNECPIRQGKRFPHYGKDFEAVRKHAATFLDCSIFIGAFFQDRLIGFAKLTLDEDRNQAGLMHILSLVQHRDKSPMNALIAQAVRSCAERRLPYLVYSNFSYGKKQRDKLTDFKEHNGFRKADVPRYYVPLSPLGRAAFRLGLHRPLAGRIPEPILARVRELRKAWFSVRFRSLMQAS